MVNLQALRYLLRDKVSKWFEEPLSGVLIRIGITPNIATLTGVLITVCGAVFIVYGQFIIAGVCIMLGAIFDLIDGSIARRTNKISDKGALMDSVMDRVSEGTVLLALVIWFSSPENNERIGIILGFLAFAGSIMVSYIRARAEGLGLRGNSGFLTRPERVVIVIVTLMLGYPIWGLWILGIGTPLSAIHRFLDAFRESNDNSNKHAES